MKCAQVRSGLSTVLVPGEVGSLHFWELATRGQWGLGMRGARTLGTLGCPGKKASFLSILGAVYRADLTHKI